jgi:DNA-binding MarR family transcriptional regulator
MWEESKAKLMEVMPIGYGSEGRPPFTEAEAERAIRNAEKEAELGRWTPTQDGNPFDLTDTRKRLMGLLGWLYIQPWKGTAGTYDRLGHMAIIRMAYRANKTRLSISARLFAEEIGTSRVATAHAVLNRLVRDGYLRRVEVARAKTEAATYDLVLEPVQYRNTLTTTSRQSCVFLSCTGAGQLVPDAFRDRDGLPKTALLLLDYLDEPKTSEQLEKLTEKARSTINRNLKPLKNEGLIEQTPEGWVRTKESLDAVAERVGTKGAAEQQRRYNEEQRQAYLRWLKGGHEEYLHEAPIQTREGRVVPEAGAAVRDDGGTELPERGAEPVSADDGPGVPAERMGEVGQNTPALLTDRGTRQSVGRMGVGHGAGDDVDELAVA